MTAETTGPALDERLEALTAAARDRGEVDGGPAPDPVNTPMIRHWVQAMGDACPVYLDAGAAQRAGHSGVVAPPAMLQVWTMRGYGAPEAAGGSAVDDLLACFDAAGYRGVVATDCEQTYDRYLHPGEHLRSATRFGGLTGPKRTAMGTGYFLTWYTTWYSDREGERVGEMLFRILKFRPARDGAPAPPPPAASAQGADAADYPLRPARSPDTDFFWAGAEAGELRIQRCAGCGALRHPPGPMCPHCHSTDRGYVVASGEGTVYSHVVHHHPPIPGRTAPFAVAVVALPEGVRVVGNVVGTDPGRVRSGMAVRVEFERVAPDLVLPQWRRAPDPGGGPGTPLPELRLPLSRTSVVAMALATRDFQDVHHDPDLARAQGSADVFVNILTTQGLVQRFVTDWAGPGAHVHASAIRLGAPAYAGDTLVLGGEVTARTGTGDDERTTVAVRGTTSAGPHVTGTVTLGPGGHGPREGDA
ncbi:OB-fold domain-containing protein [Nocardiopsis sediminis]|uniref:OB-fold domain-containing protein n=1 Tax=Nocardiopsis sediminis TaxID=1778267 RepID=A0ABV8FK22_9ACTN